MGFKSRLFAGAAFPLLSLSLVVPPAHASVAGGGNAVRPVPQVMSGSYEVAQDAPTDEELLKKKKRKAPAAEEQPAQEEQREAAPQQEAPEAEQEAPRRKKREAESEPQQAAPETQQAQPTESQQPRRKKRETAPEQASPEQQQEQAAPQAEPEQQPAENNVRPRRKQREQQPDRQEAAPQQDEVKPEAEETQSQTGEAQPEPQRPRKRDKQQQATEGEQPVKPRAKAAKEAEPDQQPAEGKAPIPEGSPAPEKAPVPAKAPAPEKPPVPAEPDQAQKPAGEEQQQLQGEQAPATTTEQPAGDTQPTEQAIPAPEKVTPEELERRKEIAEDPSKSNETVVLPVENGAAVLDSDKDADRTAGQGGRRNRDRQRASEQVIVVPKSDAEAQQLGPEGGRRAPVKIEAVTREEGRRLDRRPEFARPEGARFERYEGDDNRIILQFNNRTVVRSDDDRRFLRDGERPFYEELPRDRYRETIDRDGYQIVTIRNRYGDIIQRSRIDNRGREHVLYYSPELYEDPDRGYFEDPGADLPPMRLGIPVRDYIIDTSSDPDRDYYEFLSEPPVEPVERVYSLNEVKYSARIRDKVRRIDLDTITFATGSAEIPMSQARSLRKVADAMNEVLEKDPSETFLIEGHTDAVGSDESNLVLSDQRAESIANVLSDVYGIAPENLATQGYGERYLKVNTAGPEQENRRVTIRRVTSLVRPVASNQ